LLEANQNMAGIVLDRISKSFGTSLALDSVSLEVADGELLVLLGPSGCGKSTLLRIIAGLVGADAGRVIIDGRDMTGTPPRQRDVAMVFQSYALYPHLSVRRNLGFGLRARRRPRAEIEEKVAATARSLGLETLLDRRPRELSGGQRQRVAVGRAMVRDPAVFLMDEPLSNLDAQLRTATRVELAALHRSLEATFVYVTHDQVEAMTMATRVVVLNKGRIEQIGTPAQIYDEPASVFVAGFIGAPPMNLLPATAAGHDGQVRLRGPGIEATLWDGTLTDQPVLAGLRPERLRPGRPGPGDVGITMRVTAVENLGGEEIAVGDIGEQRVCFRGERPLAVEVGQQAQLRCPVGDLRLFDPASGRRLRWVPDADAGLPGTGCPVASVEADRVPR
jgi:multiple sugar transport system ATP-binding protein